MTDTFPPGHFYSPIPDVGALDRDAFVGTFGRTLPLDRDRVLEFAAPVYAAALEFSRRVDARATDFEWDNSQFPPADALAYYGMLRRLAPARIVEIGSGFSTLVAADAVRANGVGQITCIEPYPRPFLESEPRIELIRSGVQAVPDEVFRTLARGDVLFIDSSHQAKCQSDVLDIMFRVLDLVPPGVHVHFHDIFLPDDYPHFWLAENGIHFNEQYMLAALLKGSSTYAIRLPNAFLVRYMREAYESMVRGVHRSDDDAFVNRRHGFIKAGSFWIEKLA